MNKAQNACPEVFISALNVITCTLIIPLILKVGRCEITSLELKGCLRGRSASTSVWLGSVGTSGWSAPLSVSESLLLDVGIEPLVWPIPSRKDQV